MSDNKVARGATSLECDHCGDPAIYADPRGGFTDGIGYACQSCGIPGRVALDAKDKPYWSLGDENDIQRMCHRTPCRKCGTCACGCALDAYPEAHSDGCPRSETATWDPATRTDASVEDDLRAALDRTKKARAETIEGERRGHEVAGVHLGALPPATPSAERLTAAAQKLFELYSLAYGFSHRTDWLVLDEFYRDEFRRNAAMVLKAGTEKP